MDVSFCFDLKIGFGIIASYSYLYFLDVQYR